MRRNEQIVDLLRPMDIKHYMRGLDIYYPDHLPSQLEARKHGYSIWWR